MRECFRFSDLGAEAERHVTTSARAAAANAAAAVDKTEPTRKTSRTQPPPLSRCCANFILNTTCTVGE